ncbi:MAG: CoA transferase [Paracoccaceae bacterium]|nr:CoA transferase [Paracoccaceae bacterium]
MGLNKELNGILVVSLEEAAAAPYCGLLLADAAAWGIRVERPDRDFAPGYDSGASGETTIFAWLNGGKESVSLNLKDAKGMVLMRAMLAKADIFVSNLAPGAVMRMGLDGDNPRQVNAGLITCTLTGYGETGAAAQKKAYDFLVQAESVLCSVTEALAASSGVGISLTDLSSGLTAFLGYCGRVFSVGAVASAWICQWRCLMLWPIR